MLMVELNPALQGREFGYDDVLVLPGYSDFPIEDIDLTAKLTRGISINLPFVASPMDTVTEHRLAIANGLEGGFSFIHYNLTPEEQAEQIRKVKSHVTGFVRDPITLSPNQKISELIGIRDESGFDSFPITKDGKPDGVLVGLMTPGYYDAKDDYNKPVSELMIPTEKLRYETMQGRKIPKDIIGRASETMRAHRHIAMLPYVDGRGKLVGIITRRDIERSRRYPNAVKDSEGRLLVGAAIKPKYYEERLEMVVKAGVDAIVMDTSDGHGEFMKEIIHFVKERYEGLQIVAGNVVTKEATEFLIEAGVDALRVGLGSGSACTTSQTMGIGRLQGSAVYECAKAAREYAKKNKKEEVPTMADGDIHTPGDVLKALALGATTAMMGGLYARTEESPGERVTGAGGQELAVYRGMGSEDAMKSGGAARYGLEDSQERVPEGIKMEVPITGSVSKLVGTLAQGLKQGMIKAGVRTIEELNEKARIVEARYTE